MIGNATASGGGLTQAGELTSGSRAELDSALRVEFGDPTRSLPGRIAVYSRGAPYYVTVE